MFGVVSGEDYSVCAVCEMSRELSSTRDACVSGSENGMRKEREFTH